MKTHALTFGKRSAGRPPVVELTADDLQTIRSFYLPTNRNEREGSILLAWVRFCESRPDLQHLVKDHMPATTIPEAVRDACRKAKALVGPYRGGAARLRHESAYVPGTMRRHHIEKRRLMAGDRASVDDATRNVACWIPWPWGGCPCSEKFGVRLGRWQTLIVHDDASSFVPLISSVFRWSQSYRGTDAAAAIYRTERDVIQFDSWAVEGGVWQGKRALAVLGGRFISAKGRPNQKLVENYIGRLWDIMAGQPGDVGRHQGELKAASELYVKCRNGQADPREHFLSLTEAQNALYASAAYLAEKRIISRTYGSWVPQERWANDLAEIPRKPRADAADFLILPVAETRTVSNDTISITEDGPMGVRMVWKFTADWLLEYRGRKVTAYFDPLSEWPVQATITLEGERKPIGIATCINPLGSSKDSAIELVKSVRQTALTEVRILSKLHTERTERHLRHPSGIASTTTAPTCAPERVHVDTTPDQSAREAISFRDQGTQQPAREPLAALPRITRDDLADRLSRRAAALQD
jgi:hypothetical protein